MVVEIADRQSDLVFHALADATRRDIVVRAMQHEHSVSALARNYPMSVTAVQKHVAVLEAAGLVKKRRSGREQLVQAEVETLRKAAALLEHMESVWRARVDRMEAILAEDEHGGTNQ